MGLRSYETLCRRTTLRNVRCPSETDKYVGQKIREARKSAELTMVELAEELEISYQQIQKYESGKNRISAGILFEMACLFDRPVSYFFPQFPSAKVQSLVENESQAKLISMMDAAGFLRAFENVLDEVKKSQTHADAA